ncbi:MAG TPA: phosphohistidine phosphatase SixA [Vicinamibacterales bacterium]|nr:phosphohistidine phosphatase SixA [Vicinamibacterales bacterium]
MTLFLVHHGDAVMPDVDTRRPLSLRGREEVTQVAARAAAIGARPDVVWHSGKLRARQTAEEFWRACNALAELSATRDLQPADPPVWIRDRLRGESRNVMIVGHYPHLPDLLALLTAAPPDAHPPFPQHGVVALESLDEGETWKEIWRVERRGSGK